MDGVGWGIVIGAVFTGLGTVLGVWLTKKRELKKDEVDVLHGLIADNRKELNEVKAELRLKEIEIGKLKDENTACLISQGLMQGRIKALEESLGIAGPPRSKPNETHPGG